MEAARHEFMKSSPRHGPCPLGTYKGVVERHYNDNIQMAIIAPASVALCVCACSPAARETRGEVLKTLFGRYGFSYLY